MKNYSPIGVFDSGIGGLSVLKQFLRYMPYEKYVYLGDTARLPYGNKSQETVIEYSLQAAHFLVNSGAKIIVIACNTASSLALTTVSKEFNVPVIGMITPAATAALQATSNNRIGIIGTRATISSKAYHHTLQTLYKSSELKIFSKACPLFVPIVEEGWLEHPAAHLIAEEYLKELREKEIDTLILGCTHYPLLKPLISKILPGVNLVDSGEHAAVSAIKILANLGILVEEKNEYETNPEIEFYVTDVPSTFDEIARRFLGFDVQEPKRISL